MKKFCTTVLLIMLAMMFTSCDNHMLIDSNISTPHKNGDLVDTPSNTINDDSQPIQTPNNNLVYKNLEQGYELTFPESWRGWYVIDQPDNNSIRVKFFGKSKTGTIASKEYFGGGLPIFFIISETGIKENEPLDSVKKIGIIKGVDYYYAIGTGSDIGTLYSISDEESAVRQTAKYKVDETELQLAAQDWEKAQQMQSEVDDVLKTFKVIE